MKSFTIYLAFYNAFPLVDTFKGAIEIGRALTGISLLKILKNGGRGKSTSRFWTCWNFIEQLYIPWVMKYATYSI
jgi:hypothetical protein